MVTEVHRHAAGAIRELAALLVQSLRPRRAGTLTDGQLLERFAVFGEEAAFTLLIERHGRMVFSLARRVLGNSHDAEDVFQATFLVLARKRGATEPYRPVNCCEN